MCSCMASMSKWMPLLPVWLPAPATCRMRAAVELPLPAAAAIACLRIRRRAMRHLEMTCKSSRWSPRKSSKASTAPAPRSCWLHTLCTARWDNAPTAYSKMFSFCMKVRDTFRRIGTTSVLLSKSRFCSQLARFDKAPSASFATFLSSWALHAARAEITTSQTPLSPSCTLISGSVAKLPMNPQPSFMSNGLSQNCFIARMVSSTKPRLKMSSRYCLFLERLRTIPKAASCKPAWPAFA
mmetsp:Transcript_47904/g.154556  ORF Transcript_47904/g.154556 Transcript_47904/m.154556 type:complete len:239 (+) Transcript_47904:615-1331(+)